MPEQMAAFSPGLARQASADSSVPEDVDAAARAVHATKVFGTGDTAVRALDDVSVDLARGQFTAIMGPSGSGKSTLMHCLAGLDALTAGQVLLGGVELGALSDKQLTVLRRERVGFVFQSFNLIPTLSALENITLPLTLAGSRPDRAWLDQVIATVGVGAGDPTRDRLRRRADRQPRLALQRRDPRVPAPCRARARPDGGAGHPRPGRRGLRRPGAVPRRRPHRRPHGQANAAAGARGHEAARRAVIEMLRISLKGLWAHKRRLGGTFLAVLLGVAFLSGTLVLGDTLRANFDTLFTSVTADTGAVVRSATEVDSSPATPRGPIAASLVDRVRAAPGVGAVQPVVSGLGQIVGRDGKVITAMGPPIASTWIADQSLTPYRLAEGRAPQRADEVIINRGAAKRGDLRVGDRTTIQTPRRVPVTVVGVATFQNADGFGGSSYVGFTLGGAQQHLLKRPGQVSTVLVKAAPGVSQQELVRGLRPLLPQGVEAITGAQLSDESITDINQGFLGFFRSFLLVFAGIALVVATFSIANTFSIIVAQRTREAALLRAIGASRRQVLSSVVVEALAVGLVAS